MSQASKELKPSCVRYVCERDIYILRGRERERMKMGILEDGDGIRDLIEKRASKPKEQGQEAPGKAQNKVSKSLNISIGGADRALEDR